MATTASTSATTLVEAKATNKSPAAHRTCQPLPLKRQRLVCFRSTHSLSSMMLPSLTQSRVRVARVAFALATCVAAAPAAQAQAPAKKDSRPSSQSGSATAPAAATAEDEHGSLTATLGYGSNSSFFGRTQSTVYPYATGELTYTSKVGVWGSVMAYNLFSTATFIDETDLSFGYDHDLSQKVDFSASYSRFLFPAASPLVKASVNNSLDAALGYDWSYLYTRLNGAYLFGNGSGDFFLTLDNSHTFSIDGILTSDDYVEITPRFSVTAGTQYFAENSVQQQIKNGKPTKKATTTTVPANRFTALSYELRLPVTYTYGKVSAGVAYRYLVPVNVLPDDDSSARSYFTASLSVTL